MVCIHTVRVKPIVWCENIQTLKMNPLKVVFVLEKYHHIGFASMFLQCFTLHFGVWTSGFSHVLGSFTVILIFRSGNSAFGLANQVK